MTRQKKYTVTLDDLFGRENIRTSEVHAKFVLIQGGGFYFVIRTSMNLNANRTCESFEIDEDKEIYDFYNSFVDLHMKAQKQGFVEFSTVVENTLGLFFEDAKDAEIEGDMFPQTDWFSND